ncbi:hypothetical protein AB3S75_044896 [Citrus x aurantiifolia]
MDITFVLPPECISRIISLTTPRDACRSSIACPIFKSAADSDYVWEKFLPSDYEQIISDSVSDSSLITSLCKKDLYFHLCHNPIIVNNGTMSFVLDKESGKKCFMVRAREFYIEWGNTPSYWIWSYLPESRFAEVAELKLVWWFEIKGRIETKLLSLKTIYAAYLVFKFVDTRYGFERRPIEFGVYFEGSDTEERYRVVLDLPKDMPQLSQDRGDGWMEIKMGEFFNENGDDGTVICSVFDFDGYSPKHGIIIQGIEVRPKNGR